jgi:hypothetical protein
VANATKDADFESLSRIMLDEFKQVHDRFQPNDVRFNALESQYSGLASCAL